MMVDWGLTEGLGLRTRLPVPAGPSAAPRGAFGRRAGARVAGALSIPRTLDLASLCRLPPPSDADLDLAAKAVLKGGFSFSGQRCTAVKLVLVEKGVADALAAKARLVGCLFVGWGRGGAGPPSWCL